MIFTVYGSQQGRHAALFDAMFKMRAQVFRDRLKWDVEVRDGQERDFYDDLNPSYVMSLDDASGALRGAVRVLPTIGRHMMQDVFDAMFDEPLGIVSPLIWECTRFAVDPHFEGQVTPTGLHVATCELLQGVCDLALASGVTQLLGVSELSMLRIYRRSGWTPEVIGQAAPARTAPIFAGLWDVSPEISQIISRRAGRLQVNDVEKLAA